MSKRYELIQQIETKQRRMREIQKMMRPSTMLISNPPDIYSGQTTYQKNINDSVSLENDIYRLKDIVSMLPKENSTEIDKKRNDLISSIENHVTRLFDLYKERDFSQTQASKQIIDYQILDKKANIEDKKLILSLL